MGLKHQHIQAHIYIYIYIYIYIHIFILLIHAGNASYRRTTTHTRENNIIHGSAHGPVGVSEATMTDCAAPFFPLSITLQKIYETVLKINANLELKWAKT
jgi:hypothetical protein